MDKDKKKIIAGAGVLGVAGIIYLRTRRQPPEEPPEEPPSEDYGRARGYILDAETKATIINAKIYMDGIFQCYSDHEGVYYTDYFLFGSHIITVEADNYQKTDFPINLNETLMRIDLSLPPMPQAPTEWTEGVIVTEIEVSPLVIYLGDSNRIDVSIQYPYPLPLPANIHGSVLVDGEKLTGDFTIDFRNPSLNFPYTPTKTGVLTARAQDKSASFEVKAPVVGAIHCPFGTVATFESQNKLLESNMFYTAWTKVDASYGYRTKRYRYPFVADRLSQIYIEEGIDYSAFPPIGYKGPLASMLSRSFIYYKCNRCGYQGSAEGTSLPYRYCPQCRANWRHRDLVTVNFIYPDGWLQQREYFGHSMYTFRCRLCQQKVYEWFAQYYVGGSPSTFDSQKCLVALYDHIINYHHEFAWNTPKGGIVLAEPAIIKGYNIGPFPFTRTPVEINGFYIYGGEVLPPGTYKRYGQSIKIPAWGDRVYINTVTNEATLVEWDEIINFPKTGPWPEPI